MLYRKKKEIEWLEFEQLQPYPEIVHGIFLAPLDAGKEETSHPLIRSSLELETLVSCKQVHGAHLEVVPKQNVHLQNGCDGLLTRTPEQGLLIRHADCQAAIFFDPVNQVIANIHCGWRGNVANIYAKTVQRFREEFGSHPEDILVCISPSLGPEAAEFIHYKEELPPTFFPFEVGNKHFDLWAIAKWQLMEAGMLEKHIEIAEICTFSNEKKFFSYRRGKKTQRHATVVALKKSAI